jgi:alanyl-tRNA synthetase
VGLEPDRLYPSVYQDDDEAFEHLARRHRHPAERIFRFGKEDNFWEHGSGPCGPCSEIYYDRGEEHGCGKPTCTVGCDCDRYIEVWNVVFSQFNNDGEGNYTELCRRTSTPAWAWSGWPACARTWQSLFDVDTVMNITNKVSEITGAHYEQDPKTDVSLRVITDHIRSSVFMICDGMLPSNEGRGYVLRRLLRRAARHGKLLGVNEPFLYEVVDTVIHENECAYPELRQKQAYITQGHPHRGGELRQDHRRRHADLRGDARRPQGRGGDRLLRRRRLQALRHLRLPHRPHVPRWRRSRA